VNWATEEPCPGEAIAKALEHKGFCVLQTSDLQSSLKAAEEETEKLRSDGCFESLPVEVRQGFLGEEGTYGLSKLSESQFEGLPGLAKLDSVLTSLAASMAEQDETLGFFLSGRSLPYICESTYPKLAPPALSEEAVSEWLDVLSRQKLLLLAFIGGNTCGTLELKAFAENSKSVEVVTEQGMVVILRGDILQRKHLVQWGSMFAICAFALSEQTARWIPTTPFANELYAWAEQRLETFKDEKKDLDRLPAKWRSWTDHVFFQGKLHQSAVRGFAVRGTPTWEAGSLWNAVASGVDPATVVPLARYDVTMYYDADASPEGWKKAFEAGDYAGMKAYTNHSVFMEGADLFDNKFFKISPAETRGMDPQQRFILDVGYEALHQAGQTQKSLLRSLIGVYAAAGFSESVHVPASESKDNSEGCAQQTAGTGIAGSIMANRFSFTFGMMGPSLNVDTEASSVLVALQTGMTACSPRKLDADMALCTGSAVVMSPLFFFRACVERQCGRIGRSMTFDASADGYVRGEGCLAFVVDNLLQDVDGKLTEDTTRERYAIIDHVAVKFCPFNAVVTAPSAAHQQSLIHEALAVAGIAGTSVDHLEAHGSGQPLWDGVEFAAAQKVLSPEIEHARPVPLMVSGIHSSLGMSKVPSAGFGVMKAMMSGLFGQMASSIHLRELNPLLRDSVERNCNILTEGLVFPATKSIVGITGLGFGGTIGHAIIEMDRMDHAEANPEEAPAPLPIFWQQGELNN